MSGDYHESKSNAELIDMARGQERHIRRGWELTRKAGGNPQDGERYLEWVLADRLETLEALVADLIASWPDTESGGPILDRHEGGTWWLEHANTAAWPGCDDGPYPTCEAAVMAHVASEQKGGNVR